MGERLEVSPAGLSSMEHITLMGFKGLIRCSLVQCLSAYFRKIVIKLADNLAMKLCLYKGQSVLPCSCLATRRAEREGRKMALRASLWCSVSVRNSVWSSASPN
jgi:hypothetical protein